MSVFKTWVMNRLPDRVFNDDNAQRYMVQDYDIPPQPEALIGMGLAATIEEAQVLIDRDKTYWGGTRYHVSLDAFDQEFASQFPGTLPMFGKPNVFVKLMNQNDERDTDGKKTGEKGYRKAFEHWHAAGLIT